jgi:hypothetical protein
VLAWPFVVLLFAPDAVVAAPHGRFAGPVIERY